MLQKQVILDIKNVYTANAFHTHEGWKVGAGSETEPQVRLYDLNARRIEEIPDCPGGMMGFVPFPGERDAYVTVMGLFPPFKGLNAGLYLHRKSGQDWVTAKAMDLPFAHRCEFHPAGNGRFLVAATVSRHKEEPADWSHPGEVHIIELADPDALPWHAEVLDLPVTRNHGMSRTRLGDSDVICISGKEGIFAIRQDSGGSWFGEEVFGSEVSEMTFLDLDGDGRDELITIEPFHGEALNIYKYESDRWEQKYSGPLSFGHGLSSGIINGQPIIVAGNRSAPFSLDTFTPLDLEKEIVNRVVLEEDAGPTQTQVFTADGVEFILSANQKKNEVALYLNSGAGE